MSKRMDDLELRLRNKISAAEKQADAFRLRLEAFNHASLWQRLMIALRGSV
jgi:hypothetical protein